MAAHRIWYLRIAAGLGANTPSAKPAPATKIAQDSYLTLAATASALSLCKDVPMARSLRSASIMTDAQKTYSPPRAANRSAKNRRIALTTDAQTGALTHAVTGWRRNAKLINVNVLQTLDVHHSRVAARRSSLNLIFGRPRNQQSNSGTYLEGCHSLISSTKGSAWTIHKLKI